MENSKGGPCQTSHVKLLKNFGAMSHVYLGKIFEIPMLRKFNMVFLFYCLSTRLLSTVKKNSKNKNGSQS